MEMVYGDERSFRFNFVQSDGTTPADVSDSFVRIVVSTHYQGGVTVFTHDTTEGGVVAVNGADDEVLLTVTAADLTDLENDLHALSVQATVSEDDPDDPRVTPVEAVLYVKPTLVEEESS
jgi:hypothetical protein